MDMPLTYILGTPGIEIGTSLHLIGQAILDITWEMKFVRLYAGGWKIGVNFHIYGKFAPVFRGAE